MAEEPLFGKELAAHYDQRWEKLAPLNHSLHLLSRIILQNLAQDSHILVVGAGTGNEIFYLAEAFPSWRFTAVDISAPMLDICRQKCETKGLSSRCEFHEGSIDTLGMHSENQGMSKEKQFDAATSFLVSQFIMDLNEREQFFKEIFIRLKPGATLISADLALHVNEEMNKQLETTWTEMQKYSGATEKEASAATSQWNKKVSVSPKVDIENIIRSSGFSKPTLFYQALFIHCWYASKIS